MNDENEFEINENMNMITEEDNKQLKDSINQRNIINDSNHGKEVLDNLIHKNDKFKDIYLMMFPGGVKKKIIKKKHFII